MIKKHANNIRPLIMILAFGIATLAADARGVRTSDKADDLQTKVATIRDKASSVAKSIKIDSIDATTVVIPTEGELEVTSITPDTAAGDFTIKAGDFDDFDEDFDFKFTNSNLIEDFFGILLPIILCFIICTSAVLIIWLVLRHRSNMRRQSATIIETAIREHQPLPETYLINSLNPDRRLSSGIIWLGVGVTFFTFFAVVDTMEMAVLGFMPVFIGVARIIIWCLYRRKTPTLPADGDNCDDEMTLE